MATNLQSRAFLKSLALHAVVAAVVLALPAGPLRRTSEPDEVEVVFHRPPPPPDPLPPMRATLPLPKGGTLPAGPKTPHATPTPAAPEAPLAANPPGLPEGATEAPSAAPPKPKVGNTGILAFRDQIASVADEKNSISLGAQAHLKAAADANTSSPRDYLLNAVPGGSGGINSAALSRSVGGGGGGTGGAGGGGMQGVAVGRATDALAGIGGGGGSRGHGGSGSGSADGSTAGPGAKSGRTDEEIQIVFDKHKSSFYRLYHEELRNDPTLKGQMVLKLTIEPDGSVSMCTLQSSDMKAPALAAQVVQRVRAINFGAKDVPALTIVYPIDFLPAA